MEKIPKNKYTKLLLRTIKDLDLTYYLDINQVDAGCKREDIKKDLNTIEAAIMMPDLFLSLEIPDSKYRAIEIEYYNRIREDIIDKLCEVIEKSFKGYCYNNINTDTVDFRLRFATAKNKIITNIKGYINSLFHLSTKYFYVKLFRGCDITPDGYDPILTKIMNEIKNGKLE